VQQFISYCNLQSNKQKNLAENNAVVATVDSNSY